MQYGAEDVLQAQKDLLGLLGFELELQILVVEKIWGFMAKIVHRVISDMCNLGLSNQLEDMWCGYSIGLGDRPALNEVLHLPTNIPSFILSLLHNSIQYATMYAIMCSFECYIVRFSMKPWC
jgi:hypothetical protein